MACANAFAAPKARLLFDTACTFSTIQRQLSRVFMAHVWNEWSAPTDENARETKEELVKHARGIVLDIGAGHGSLARYLTGRATAYVALEPNGGMHKRLRAAAEEAGFSEAKGNFLLVPVGLEDVEGIRSLLISSGISKSGQVDTAVSVLVLCSVPKPEETLKAFVSSLLAPGGRLLWYEHVQNEQPDIAFWQGVISPIWGGFLDQCRLGQDTVSMITAEKWASLDHWTKANEPDSFFIHSAGVAVRKS